MKCPICGKDMELRNKQTGTDENGNPVFHQYAICKDCKKQWNLDKQRAKKTAVKKDSMQKDMQKKDSVKKTPSEKSAEGKKDVPVAKSIPAVEVTTADSTKGENSAPASKKPAEARKKRPVSTDEKAKSDAHKAPTGSTAKAVARKAPADGTAKTSARKAPADGTAKTSARKAQADGTAKTSARKAPADGTAKTSARKAPADGTAKTSVRKAPADSRTKSDARKVSSNTAEQKYGNIPSEKVRKKREAAVKKGYEDMLATDTDSRQARRKKADSSKTAAKEKQWDRDTYDEETTIQEDEYVEKGRFSTLRIILGLLSLVAFGFFAYNGFIAGLDSISSGIDTSAGMTFIVLAVCALAAGLALLIMHNSNNVFAFILPVVCYVACGVFAFLKRSENENLMFIAIGATVAAVIFIILTIASRVGSGDDTDDYDDPFEEDFD